MIIIGFCIFIITIKSVTIPIFFGTHTREYKDGSWLTLK
uniref:Uncharacterized protein n=1 Tax=Yersinia enterocolitica W22703 TaxID=913028 RepID=F4N841_YEREN|nr:unknown protein [Yersinia enterocolitica W22703]